MMIAQWCVTMIRSWVPAVASLALHVQARRESMGHDRQIALSRSLGGSTMKQLRLALAASLVSLLLFGCSPVGSADSNPPGDATITVYGGWGGDRVTVIEFTHDGQHYTLAKHAAGLVLIDKRPEEKGGGE